MSGAEPAWQGRARQLLRSAAALLELGDVDSAVSRAYYAMFFAAEALLESKGLSYSSHGEVIGAFGREFAKTGMLPSHLHRALIDASRARQVSDYAVRSGITPAAGAEQVERAEEFVGVAERYFDNLVG